MVQFKTQKPPPAIADHVSEMWLLEDDGAPSVGMPKPFVELVVSLRGVHFWKPSKNGDEVEYTTAWVTPIQDGPRYARAVGGRKLMGARLFPWAANAWLGSLPSGNGGSPPELSSLLGEDAASIQEWLSDAPDEHSMFTRFGAWLASHLESDKAQTHKLRDIALEPSDTVETLAKSLNVSEPTLRRSFASNNGVAPKRWLILRRLDQILRDPRLSDPGHSLAQLAAEYGFADQAHLSREMLRYTGTSPTGLRQRDENYPPHMLDED
ncbi:MAG: helix-turn-helix domain-containing protein [Pseudomonadota bacterium]